MRTLPNAPVGYEAQAKLIKRLGYDGLAGHKEETYYELRAAMNKVGLEMPEMYIALNIIDGKISYHSELKNILEDSKDRNLLVTLHLHADEFMNNKTEGDKLFVQGLRELADFGKPLHIQFAIYPHVGFYCETLEHAVGLVKAADRKNVGVVFNLCHLLKVEGEQGWQEKAKAALPYLFMVSINGADRGNTKEMGWDQLIQPLGEGSFDTYQLVKFLKDNGYKGKFGLQCYNIKQDCEVALTKSINTWNEYRKRYAQEK
ncbi:MAG TPA: TIM barrel protein [Draconibacterium sp.]|nr:TIM barrel protein [Draconibacterium sp.]